MTVTWDSEQQANADTIIRVGRGLGASDRDIQVALMTAMQESGLKNINYGDAAGPDSLGLFQQRAPWGPAADRMNPAKAAYMFFTGGQGGQRGLFDFKARDQMSLTQAAQAVQVSAFPDAYAKWSDAAQQLMGSHPAIQGPVIPGQPALGSETVTRDDLGQVAASTLNQNPTTPQAAATAPGTGEVTAPGTQAGAPGLGDATAPGATDPTQPDTSMTEDQFHALFPDAAATKMFTAAQGNLDARRNDVISTAMSYIGTPYVWGGNGRQGLDCSGLVQQVYKSFGIDVPRLSADQINAGQRVAYNQLKPGDLIGWDENSRNVGADHVAVYAGNNQIIEAPRPGLAVRLRSLDQHEIDTALGSHFAQLG